jgi:hypothetical protein
MGEASGSMPHPQSPRATGIDQQSMPAAYQKDRTDAAVADITGAYYWPQLKHFAEVILGPYSFGLGVCLGVVKNPVSAVGDLLDLQRTFILADIYDRINGKASWLSSIISHSPLGTAVDFGRFALQSMGMLGQRRLERAYEQREAIKKDLGETLGHPVVYLAGLPAKMRDEYVAKWKQFSALSAQGDLKTQFQAGEILGDVLMDVAMTVGGAVSGVGAATKVAAKIPELLRLGRVLKEARISGGGAAGAVAAAEESAVTARAPKAAREPGPRPIVAEQPDVAPKPAEPKQAKAASAAKPPPKLPGVTAQERALAASSENTPAARQAREKVVKSYLREYGSEYDPETKKFARPTEEQIRDQLNGHDLTRPITVCPPPPCPPEQVQWQRPGGKQGSYYSDPGVNPDKAGISAYATDTKTGVIVRKVTKVYTVQEQAPYLESMAAPVNDTWSIRGLPVPTSGGAVQRVIGDRALAAAASAAGGS